MPPAVQYLPPAPIDPALHFDQHTHSKDITSIHLVSAESRLTFSDIERMGPLRKSPQRHKRWIPAWVVNDEMFRQVILHRAWRYVHAHAKMPSHMTWRRIKMLCDRTAINAGPNAAQTVLHRLAVERVGGYLEFMVKILWLSLRMGFSSVEVAGEFGAWLTPQCVRIQVYRANAVARKLGFPVFKVEHHSRKGDYQAYLKRAHLKRRRKTRRPPE